MTIQQVCETRLSYCLHVVPSHPIYQLMYVTHIIEQRTRPGLINTETASTYSQGHRTVLRNTLYTESTKPLLIDRSTWCKKCFVCDYISTSIYYMIDLRNDMGQGLMCNWLHRMWARWWAQNSKSRNLSVLLSCNKSVLFHQCVSPSELAKEVYGPPVISDWHK